MTDEPVSLHGPELDALPARRRALLAFTWDHQRGDRRFFAQPQMPFHPKGLAIYGAPAGACVECWIGIDLQAVVSWGDVPAKFFGSDLSFAQIAAKLDAGQEPPGWVEWKPIKVGDLVQLAVYRAAGERHALLGPPDGVHVVMWGHSAL